MLFVISLCLCVPIVSNARWASSEQAPLHIKRLDETVTVNVDGTWKSSGVVEVKVNTQAGRALLATYKFPALDENEQIKFLSAEILDQGKTRTVATNLILPRDIELPNPEPRIFRSQQNYVIPFGDSSVGAIAKIEFEIESKKTRIPGLFSRTFEWGRKYPQLAGTLTFESKEQLFIDVSKGARSVLSFSKGRQADGTTVLKVEQKKPVFVKAESEQGGLITTAVVPRVQIANKNSWQAVADALAPGFSLTSQDIFPRDLQKIVDQVKPISNLNERLDRMIELLHQTANYTREWSTSGGGLTPNKLLEFVQLKGQSRRADSKDFAFAAVAVLRALGYDADVALVWRQSPTEKVWIEETPTTPSLEIFNHAMVRLLDGGRPRYFDPTNSIPFGEGFLSDVGGSWALTLKDQKGKPAIFERLPNEAPVTSMIKINQTLDLRPDASIVGSGTVKVEGPLAAELKQVYFAQGALQVEPYLRSLFGLALKTESVSPMIHVNAQDRSGKSFDLKFSYLAPNVLIHRGQYREFDLTSPGLAGVPLLASPDRATDVILSRNLTLEVETKVVGGEIADETNTSCLALTSFASLLRETRTATNSFTLSDHVQFKVDHIPTSAMKTQKFQNEISAYSNCLLRTHAIVGPRPAFEKSQLGLSPSEVAVLKKPATLVTLQDIRLLDEVNSPQLNMLIGTKTWLAAREMLRRNLRSPPVMLEYANALLQTGRVQTAHGDAYLIDHVTEAAKLFGAVGVQGGKTAKFHRVHATMLLATDRPNEAIVALQNAIALEPGQGKDALLAGQIYLRLGQEAKAETWLRLATRQKGSKSLRLTAIENFAEFRLKQKRIQDFVALYKLAISESPGNAWIYYDFSKQLATVKLWDLAIENARKALSLSRFAEGEALLAQVLIRKAESIYFVAPNIPTADPRVLDAAEVLALECLKYTRSEILAYRIAGHATFMKAIGGDYGSLIATQSYFAKARELGANDPWIDARLAAANQSLETSRPIAQIWTAYVAASQAAARNRVPAAKSPAATVDPGTLRFPVK